MLQDITNTTCSIQSFHCLTLIRKNRTFMLTQTLVKLQLLFCLLNIGIFRQVANSHLMNFSHHLGRLGLIICEDLLWYYPTVDLVASNGVDTIIFPTEWWDEYPHQLPHVDQASWAKALQVRYNITILEKIH